MRILMISPNVRPTSTGTVIGGASRSMVNLAQALIGRGHEVGLIAGMMDEYDTHHAPSVVPWYRAEIISVKSRGSTRSYGVEFLLRLSLAVRRFKNDSVDVVHGHSGYSDYIAGTYAASKVVGAPSIHTLYCPVTPGRLTSRLLNSMDLVTGMSRNVGATMLAAGARRAEWLPPIVPGADPPASSVGGSAVRDEFVIAFVGSTNATKGLDLLLSAVSLVPLSIPVKLALAIEPPDRRRGRDDERIASLIPQVSQVRPVDVHGIVSDMDAFLGASDLLVLPFRTTDGPSDYPLVLLEAMNARVPVLATDVGGVSEVIEDGRSGYLAAPDDVASLAEGIIRAYVERQHRGAVGDRARQTIRDMFDEQTVVSMVEGYYREYAQ